jgi:hypothetical protein
MSNLDYFFKATDKNLKYAELIGNALGALRSIQHITNDKEVIEYAKKQYEEISKKSEEIRNI